MFKIFYDLDDLDNIESNLVAQASSRLDIGEFQVFQLSYVAWHGHDAEPAQMEAIFFKYLYEDEMPPWVRHYTRQIIQQDEAGLLAPGDPSYHRFDAASMRTGTVVPTWIRAILVFSFLLFLVGVAMTFIYGSIPNDIQCWFPPCPQITN